jgi:hypothetical protein
MGVLSNVQIKAYIAKYYENHPKLEVEKALPADLSVEKFKEIFAEFDGLNDQEQDVILDHIKYLFNAHTLATIEAYIEAYENNPVFKEKYINFLVVLLQKRIDDIKHVSDKDFFGLYEATRNLNEYDDPHDVWTNYFNKLEEVLGADLNEDFIKTVKAYQAGFKTSQLQKDYTNDTNVYDQVQDLNHIYEKPLLSHIGAIKTYTDPEFFGLYQVVRHASDKIWNTYWDKLGAVLRDDAASKKINKEEFNELLGAAIPLQEDKKGKNKDVIGEILQDLQAIIDQQK